MTRDLARARMARSLDGSEYRLVIWRAGVVDTFTYTEPVDALAAAVDYLKSGYQCRLGSEVVEHFRSQPNGATSPAWLPDLADWKLINGVLGRALLVRGFFHPDAEPVARARAERLRAQIGETIARIARHM